MRSNKPNPSSRFAGATYLDSDAAVAALRRLAVAAAQADPRILRVTLIGSLARGTATPASDADLIIVLAEAEPRRMDRIPGLLKLFEQSPLPLDLRPYTAAEWERARKARAALYRLANAEGLDLLEEATGG